MYKNLRVVAPLAVSFVVFVLISGLILAQDKNDEQKTKPTSPTGDRYELAKTEPISHQLFVLNFTVDNQAPVRVLQREGGMIRVEKDSSWILGFTPYREMKTSELLIKVFLINPIKRDGAMVGEGIYELETIKPDSQNQPLAFNYENTKLMIGIAQADDVPELKKNPIGDDKQHYLASNCCIWCGGIKICGCVVSASCGGCVDPTCGSGNNTN